MAGVDVIRKGSLTPGYVTEGITRTKAFEDEWVVFSTTTVAPLSVSAWHHHGQRTLYAYVLSGSLRLEHGPGGMEAEPLAEGDFLHINPGVVHRDVNPDNAKSLVVVSLMLGPGPAVVNLDGPEN